MSLALSTDPDFDLTLEGSLPTNSSTSPLMPIKLSDADRKFYESQLSSTRKSSPLLRVLDAYDKLRIKPYVKFRDLSDPLKDQQDPDRSSKPGVEIGVRFGF